MFSSLEGPDFYRIQFEKLWKLAIVFRLFENFEMVVVVDQVPLQINEFVARKFYDLVVIIDGRWQ